MEKIEFSDDGDGLMDRRMCRPPKQEQEQEDENEEGADECGLQVGYRLVSDRSLPFSLDWSSICL